jgi:nicotinate-nucleotide adenylyltransferase
MKVGLYFGSFNPIHNGHLHIARQTLQQLQLDCVWLIVSPQNPFKDNLGLAPQNHRLAMVELACVNEENISASNIEFNMPLPSFTINTVKEMLSKHPEYSFQLIIGEDNLLVFDRWKDYEELLRLTHLIVYPRENATPHIPIALQTQADRIHFLKGELLPVSATELRSRLKMGSSILGLTPDAVAHYIQTNKLYV